ncbi:MAG TPA: nicotinate-nucleotide adenylyltransferase [Acidimicrobiales bacterium]|jgi:nicotinate-nucleotide adenylyltransferase|nr:nicotinate-nucleotide adenylyltransferase [Acidimicrobiales bacterium]
MLGRPERIGLLGGTFDPPHAGHLAAARACRDALSLDRLLLVVANHPWQKAPRRQISPADDRLALTRAAVDGEPGLEVSRIEIDRGGPSYTVETVEALRASAARASQPMPEVFVIVGADLVDSLPTWRRPDELRQLVTLVVVSRPRSPTPTDPPGWSVVHLDGGGVDVSSSEVRSLVTEGEGVEGLVPDAVIRCISRRGLYAVGR